MEKLLDYLNKDIKVNTVEGAKQAVDLLLADNEIRQKHIYGVVEQVKDILSHMNLSEEMKSIIIQAAYLHDIGYSGYMNSSKFHAIDGYVYLKNNNWHPYVYKTALFHSFSKELLEMDNVENTTYDTEYILSADERMINDIVTLADLHTSSQGLPTSYQERIHDVKERYGEDSTLYLHLKMVETEVYRLRNTYNIF